MYSLQMTSLAIIYRKERASLEYKALCASVPACLVCILFGNWRAVESIPCKLNHSRLRHGTAHVSCCSYIPNAE